MTNRLQLARCNLPHHLKTFVREQIAGRPAKFWKEIGPRFSPSCLKETTYSDHPHPINSERIPKVEPLQRFHPTAPNPAIHGHPASAPPCHWEAPALNWQGHFLVFKFGSPQLESCKSAFSRVPSYFFWGENHVNHYHFVLIETSRFLRFWVNVKPRSDHKMVQCGAPQSPPLTIVIRCYKYHKP